MEDSEIIDLYFARNEDAIYQTSKAHGAKLYSLAHSILQNREDAEESVSDTYMKAWNAIPPTRPEHLYAYLAKICRFVSFGVLDWRNAAKRKAEIVELSQEMETCIPDPRREQQMESEELGRVLNAFLGTLSAENRMIFMRRYWYSDSIELIAARCRMSESKVKSRLFRIRNTMRIFLSKEGVAL